MVHRLNILAYDIPMNYIVLYLSNFSKENIQGGDRYPVKILLIGCKKKKLSQGNGGKQSLLTWNSGQRSWRTSIILNNNVIEICMEKQFCTGIWNNNKN